MGSGNSLGPCILSLMPKYGGNILPDKYLNNPHGIRNGGKRKFLKAKLEEQYRISAKIPEEKGLDPQAGCCIAEWCMPSGIDWKSRGRGRQGGEAWSWRGI